MLTISLMVYLSSMLKTISLSRYIYCIVEDIDNILGTRRPAFSENSPTLHLISCYDYGMFLNFSV